jgi:hypothetical protein
MSGLHTVVFRVCARCEKDQAGGGAIRKRLHQRVEWEYLSI